MSKQLFFYILFFVCFGMTTEVFFTAISDWANGTGDLRLQGHTYIWMAFIYGLIPVLFGWIYPKVAHWHTAGRLVLFVAFVYLIEFVAGGLLDILTGQCPWEYTTGWHIMGYIRLDYAPFWAFFGFLIERLYLMLENIVRT